MWLSFDMKGRSQVGQIYHHLILITAVIYVASGTRTTVNCDGTFLSKQFYKVFNIGILVDGKTVAQIEGKSKINVPVTNVSVTNPTGLLSRGDKHLSAVLDVECQHVDSIQCEIYGLQDDRQNYNTEKFKPLITFDVADANTSISKTPDKGHYSSGDVVMIKCFANVGSNNTKWRFQVDRQGVSPSEYDVEEESMVTAVSPSNCVYHTVASVNVTVKEEGQVRIRCMVDSTEVGTVTLDSVDIEAILSLHLFLSSIFLVYVPFIIMPSLWCSCKTCAIKWRNPEKAEYKYFRSAMSVGDSVAFMIWWVCMYTAYSEKDVFASYGTFACIEGAFIFVYALYRCLFKHLESSDSWFGVDHAYNARVATSHGAVMTPIICWVMIKFSRGLSCTSIEIFFWIVAIPSLLSFAFVSHRREGVDWTSKQQ